MRRKRRLSDDEIRRQYREVLGRPRLSGDQIDRMRVQVRLLAQAVCEHVWKKKAF